MTEKNTKSEIHQKFVEHLDEEVKEHSEFEDIPFEIYFRQFLPSKIRVYAYNVTHPPGGRSNGEHKAQLILPNQSHDERASFDHSDGYTVLLLGYVPDSDVFILWDAGLHRDFAYSKNVQVKAETVYKALAGEIGTQVRHLQTGDETVVTTNPNNLAEAIELRSELTQERLISE
jgi:hypothetical protein